MKKEEKQKFYVASVSWAKDSVWMLSYLLENCYQVDLVIFVNTGMEFDAVYGIRDTFLEELKILGIPYVEIDVSEEFQYRMFEHRVKTLDGSEKIGYGWCGGVCRWGTCLKIEALNQYYRVHLSQYNVVEYVGIAFDERERVDEEALKKGRKIYPLVAIHSTQQDSLRQCYKRGYYWLEDGIRLYDYFDRLSCWCCKNKNLKELKAMYYLFAKYWERLKALQLRLPFPMKGDSKSVFELEGRFQKEGWCLNLFHIGIEGEVLYGKEEDADEQRKINRGREPDYEGNMDISGGYFHTRINW